MRAALGFDGHTRFTPGQAPCGGSRAGFRQPLSGPRGPCSRDESKGLSGSLHRRLSWSSRPAGLQNCAPNTFLGGGGASPYEIYIYIYIYIHTHTYSLPACTASAFIECGWCPISPLADVFPADAREEPVWETQANAAGSALADRHPERSVGAWGRGTVGWPGGWRPGGSMAGCMRLLDHLVWKPGCGSVLGWPGAWRDGISGCLGLLHFQVV